MDNELLKGYYEQQSILIEKINFFRKELAISADASQKFSLKKNIESIEKELSKIDLDIEYLEVNSDEVNNSSRTITQGDKSIFIERNNGTINFDIK